MSDPLHAGTAAMLELRASRIAAGETPIGWKLGFGAPAMRERLGTTGPLVGFLTDATVIEPGSIVDIGSWTRPVAEAEIALWFDAAITAADSIDDVAAAIGAIGPAVELADIEHDPGLVERAVAGNIFHRAVIFGERDRLRARADLAGLSAHVSLDGGSIDVGSDLEALTGRLVDVAAHAAAILGDHGAAIAAGDVIIAGSIVPPVAIGPGRVFEFVLGGAPPISVELG